MSQGKLDPALGMCGDCAHARTIVSARGSRFTLCERSKGDPSYPRYPRLPVTQCQGWEPRQGDPADE